MYLRDLQLDVSPLSDVTTMMSRDEWRRTLHTVVEQYLDELPRRKVELGGAAKIVVVLGPRETTGPLSHGDFGLADGLGMIWLPTFDFVALARADLAERQRLFIEALHKGLLEIASRIGSDPAPFVTARETLLSKLPLPEITEKELLIRWGFVGKARRRRRSRG
jgi:hypothetical protein